MLRDAHNNRAEQYAQEFSNMRYSILTLFSVLGLAGCDVYLGSKVGTVDTSMPGTAGDEPGDSDPLDDSGEPVDTADTGEGDSADPEDSGLEDTGLGEDSGDIGTAWPEPDGCGPLESEWLAEYIANAEVYVAAAEASPADYDNDGDGVPTYTDCDDTDASIGSFMVTSAAATDFYGTTEISVAINDAGDGGTIIVCGWNDLPNGINVNTAGEHDGWTLTFEPQDAEDPNTLETIPASITGSTSSGLEVINANISMRDMLFYGNTATSTDIITATHPRGAGIRLGEGSSLTSVGLMVVSNTIGSADHGAGIYVNDAELDLMGAFFVDNVHDGSGSGGKGAAIYATDASVLDLDYSYLVDNGNSTRGNGLHLRGDEFEVDVTATCFTGGQPADIKVDEGEAVVLDTTVTFTISGADHVFNVSGVAAAFSFTSWIAGWF